MVSGGEVGDTMLVAPVVRVVGATISGWGALSLEVVCVIAVPDDCCKAFCNYT